MQLALVMRTEVARALGVAALLLERGREGERAPEGIVGAAGAALGAGTAPPGSAASASPALQSESAAAAAAARGVSRLWARVLAMRIPSQQLSPPDGGVRG
jgi:hypothetical protein